MKRLALVGGILASLAIGQATPVWALPAGTFAFGDSTIYWKGYESGSAYKNSLDSINWPAFSGGSATINADGELTKVDFFDVPADHIPPGVYDPFLHNGDLFIDLDSNSTWDYVVKTTGSSLAGYYDLFNIAALAVTTSPADAAKYKDGYVRDNQPVALLSTSGATLIGKVYWSGYYDAAIKSYSSYYDFGVNAIDLGMNQFIIGYSSDCGNDVILEQVPVPEPGTMALLGFGLLGMAIYGKRRMKKHD